jgi:hypothetical protein
VLARTLLCVAVIDHYSKDRDSNAPTGKSYETCGFGVVYHSPTVIRQMDKFASQFEFRHRTWFIFGIFCVGLACYWVDPQNSSVVLARSLRSHIALCQTLSPHTSIRLVFLIGALIVVLGGIIRAWGGAYLRAEVVQGRTLPGSGRYIRRVLPGCTEAAACSKDAGFRFRRTPTLARSLCNANALVGDSSGRSGLRYYVAAKHRPVDSSRGCARSRGAEAGKV